MAPNARTSRAKDLGRQRYRFTADEVLAMSESLRADAELWDGVLYQMVEKEAHNVIVSQVADLIRPLLPPGFHLREEKSCRDGEWSLPEPDVAIARGGRTEFLPDPPPLERMALIVEVNHHSARADHVDKLRRYAEVRVPVYWIVEVRERSVLVHEDPTGQGESAGYGRRTIYPRGSLIPVVIDGQGVGQIPSAELFPPEHSD